jgi:hypothetical protein
MRPTKKNALSGGGRQGEKDFSKSFWAKYAAHGAAVKRAIVFLAMRDLLPANLATWLLRHLNLVEV